MSRIAPILGIGPGPAMPAVEVKGGGNGTNGNAQANGNGRPQLGRSPQAGTAWGGFGGGYAGGNILLQIAGTSGLCWDGQSFRQPPRYSDATYALMDLHPTLTLVRALITAPIQASKWNYLKRDDAVPAEKVDRVKRQLEPLRRRTVREALRALTHGRWPFEKVWEVREGTYWLSDLVSLPAESWSVCRYDRTGKFAGVTATGRPEDRLDERKSWLCVNDMRGQNLWGQSRHEAAYEPWCDWNRTRLDAMKLRSKVSGIIPLLVYPPGTSLVDGKEVDNAEIARQMLAALPLGVGTYFPGYAYGAEEIAANPNLAKVTSWQLDFYDAGNMGPAIDGFIQEREYDDKLLVRAWCRPERSVLEATTSGSRADSVSHSDNAILDTENVDDEIADQLNHGPDGTGGVVDDILVINGGPDDAGAVFIEPAPIEDKRLGVFKDLLGQFLADPQFRAQLINATDKPAMLEALGAPLGKDATFEPVKAVVPVPPGMPPRNGPPQPGDDPKPPRPPALSASAVRGLSLLGRLYDDGE